MSKDIELCIDKLKKSIETESKEKSLELLKDLENAVDIKIIDLESDVDDLKDENADLEFQIDNLTFELEFDEEEEE